LWCRQLTRLPQLSRLRSAALSIFSRRPPPPTINTNCCAAIFVYHPKPAGHCSLNVTTQGPPLSSFGHSPAHCYGSLRDTEYHREIAVKRDTANCCRVWVVRHGVAALRPFHATATRLHSRTQYYKQANHSNVHIVKSFVKWIQVSALRIPQDAHLLPHPPCSTLACRPLLDRRKHFFSYSILAPPHSSISPSSVHIIVRRLWPSTSSPQPANAFYRRCILYIAPDRLGQTFKHGIRESPTASAHICRRFVFVLQVTV
jgi:hypothetical protein